MISEELREFRSVLRRWADADVAPYAADVDQHARFPDEAWQSFVKHGWVKLAFPVEYGGEGADATAYVILIEELARACAATSLTILVSKLAMTPVLLHASEALKKKYVPHIASGDQQASYCLSEPEAGSDVAAMKTVARREGDSYVLNGVKCWISNAGVSEQYVVFAKTDPDAGRHGITCFLVEQGHGVQFGKFEHKLGMRGSPTGEVIFHDVRVPAENVVGKVGQGFAIALETLDRSRPVIGAQAVGIASAALDYAVGYMQQRRQFGKELAEFQGLRFMVADMAMRIEAARQLVYEAAALIESGDPHGELNMIGSMAKCFASDAAMEVTTNAVQLLGGYGYTSDFPVERFIRDAKLTQIYEGTNQIQRIVISRNVFGAHPSAS